MFDVHQSPISSTSSRRQYFTMQYERETVISADTSKPSVQSSVRHHARTCLRVVVHTVCIGQDSPPLHHEATAAAAVLPLALPWEGEVRLCVDAEHLRPCVKHSWNGA